MIALAFTGPDARRPFVGGHWPEPGTWADEPRASLIRHLPIWIAAELWIVELDGSVHEVATQLRADRGRRVRQIAGWDAETAQAIAASCADRILELAEQARNAGVADDRMGAYRADAEAFGRPADANVAGWVAARAAAAVEGEDGAARERERQAAWLAERLDLETAIRL